MHSKHMRFKWRFIPVSSCLKSDMAGLNLKLLMSDWRIVFRHKNFKLRKLSTERFDVIHFCNGGIEEQILLWHILTQNKSIEMHQNVVWIVHSSATVICYLSLTIKIFRWLTIFSSNWLNRLWNLINADKTHTPAHKFKYFIELIASIGMYFKD